MVESLYSKLYNTEEIAKQRIVERFCGDALDERWRSKTVLGAGASNTMRDVVDGGLSMTTISGGASPREQLDFNDIRQYSCSGSVIIGIASNVATSDGGWYIGFASQNFCLATNIRIENLNNFTGICKMRLLTTQGGTTTTLLTTCTDDNLHLVKGVINSTSVTAYIDGFLEGTTTGNIPTARMQPFVAILGESSCTVMTSYWTYLEAYNT